MSTSKDNILNRIKASKDSKSSWEVFDLESDNFFSKKDGSLVDIAKNALELVNGEFIQLTSSDAFEQELKNIFSEKEVICFDQTLVEYLSKNNITVCKNFKAEEETIGFATCEAMVARLGSVVTSSQSAKSRQANIFPTHQVILVKKDQLVYDLKDAMTLIENKYSVLPSLISFATGPSRTADIEKTLILGAHGPKKLTVVHLDFDA